MTDEKLEKEARFRTKGWKEQENCVQAYLAGAEPREKRNEDLEKENAELKKQIVDLKDYVFKVSKFLHNNNNVRPDNLVYKERDVLLIKELKLCEKWGDLR